jgi:hypothetical protein
MLRAISETVAADKSRAKEWKRGEEGPGGGQATCGMRVAYQSSLPEDSTGRFRTEVAVQAPPSKQTHPGADPGGPRRDPI